MKAIYGEQFQGGLEVPGGLVMFLGEFFFARRTKESQPSKRPVKRGSLS
jgi:hypothetical protein